MIVNGAIVPPPAVLNELTEATLAALPVAPEVSPAPSRWRRRKPEVVAPAPPPLALIDPADMRIPITGFGNLTNDDVIRLTQAITVAASEWPVPSVHFAGVETREMDGSRSLWATLSGDVDALEQVARGVIRSVERNRFYTDRRKFRPALKVAEAAPESSVDAWDAVAASLSTFRGRTWPANCVVLATQVFSGSAPELREIEWISIGAPTD